MKVVEFQTNTFWKGESGVKGLVEDGDVEYKASLFVKGGRVYDYSCTCPQGNSFKGMCSHCSALLKAYEDKAKGQQGKIISTSQQARTMIREYTNREVARIISEEEEVQVCLKARLLAFRGELKIELLVGKDRFYVVKDLVAFVKAVEAGAYVEYGKNLAFHHKLSSFEPQSRVLAEFVLELVNLYCEHHAQFQKSSFGTVPVLRQLNLNKANRERFFALTKGSVLELEDWKGQKRRLTVAEENPDLTVRVQEEGRDGICVSIDKGLMFYKGESRLFLMDQEKVYCCDPDCSETLEVFLEQMIEGFGASFQVEINEKDMPLFYERVLKKIAAYCSIDAAGINLEEYKPEELKAKFEFDSLGPDQVVLRPTLSYGAYSFQPVEDEKLPRTVCRDVPAEFRISQVITRYFHYKESDTDYPAIRGDEEGIYKLLTQGLAEFSALGQVYLSDNMQKIRVLPPPKISFGVTSKDNWLELQVDTDGMSREELIGILTEYSGKKKYYRLKTGEFIGLDESGLGLVAKLTEGLSIEEKDFQAGRLKLPFYRAFYLDSMLKEGKGVTFYRDHLFKAVVRGMKSVEDSDFEIPQSLRGILREYQKTGFRWLKTLDSYGFGGILADDMGLGKTIQIIALLLDECGRSPQSVSLIVCPASLVYNWENELKTFAPSLKVKVIAGTAGEREAALKEKGGSQVLITSYDLLKRDSALYLDYHFRFHVIDEAQYIKNAATQTSKAVKTIHSKTRFALTGTPIENRLSELWSIFDFLMPGFLFTYPVFRRNYEIPVVKEQDGESLLNLRRLIGPFILRRLKKDVLKELPEKLETVVYSGFDKAQKDLYTANAFRLKEQLEQARGEMPDRIQILAQLTRLRQICCDPHLCYDNYKGDSAKLDTCMDLVKNGLEGGHKILLFSQFTSMLEIIETRLKKDNLPFYKLTGATPKEERLHMVASFKGEGPSVFLISLKAGGTGLNLTAADMVIHYDPWWNLAAQNQATDRAHRIGQENQVTVFKLITKGTIEENILKLQESKKNLADQVITEGTVSLGSLSKDDILGLLQ